MFKRVVVALDGSEIAERLVALMEELGRTGSEIVLVQATVPVEEVIARTTPAGAMAGGGTVDAYELTEQEAAEAERYLSDIADRLRARKVRVETVHEQGKPAEVILRVAQERGADLIAMTTHGRGGISRLVFGSVTEEVLRHTAIPVLVMPVREAAKT